MPIEPLILASSSPRRQELLASMGVPFEVHAADVDENLIGNPEDVVRQLSFRKAEALFQKYPDRFVLAADTLVSIDGLVFGKPVDHQEALRMIAALQGTWHEVHSGVCLLSPQNPGGDIRHAMTRVHFVPLSDAEILAYVNSGEPEGKAGAYAIQGRAGMFVSEISGSYSNVIGLPTALVRDMLKAHHYPQFQ